MTDETGKDKDAHADVTKVLNDVLEHVTNEAVLLAQYQRVQPSKIPHLWSSKDGAATQKRLDRIEYRLGGPPAAYIVRADQADETPLPDNYPYAAISEALSVFALARKSVVRAHMFMAGVSMVSDEPALKGWDINDDATGVLIEQAQDAFWEHAEAAYIRLYSFWDRLGQVFDFAFFNIRKFDQNGFYAVMERISANAVPMDTALQTSESWKRLRKFSTSESDDGLKWLLLRRNLIVHSLHLHPVRADEEGVFRSQFNHLERTHREKLRPRSVGGEVAQLLLQLQRATDLFPDALCVLEMAPERSHADAPGVLPIPPGRAG